ncbi:MAG: hypothetical protein JXB05_15905 [Myxococcaceae bacterium]|nr:hypothetical protein [Myxococcaceae bacterium]
MPPEFGKPTSAARSSSGKSSANVKALAMDDSGPKKSNNELAVQECEALEEELAALRATYEQYFLGNERLPPTRTHEDLKKRLNRLKTGLVRNTAVKFRISSLHNKFLTYERLWQRTLQEIEAGTYKRDLFKAKRRAQKANAQGERRQGAFELTEELSEDDLEEISDIIPNEPQPVAGAASKPRFIPQPVEPAPAAVPFRPVPAVAAVPGVAPSVPTVSPVAAASTGTPFRGTPSVAPVPAGTPARGTSVPPPSGAQAKAPGTTPPGATPGKGTATIPPGATPARGTATIPPGATPAKGTATIPPGGTPAKGTATIPPGGTPARGTGVVPPGGTPARGTSGLSSPPARGVPSFGAPSQGTSGIAAALESLTDEPLGKPAAGSASRPPASTASRPGATSSVGSKPGAPAAKPATPSSPPRPAASPASTGLSDDKLKAVYDAYVTAKRRNQEDTSKMNFESVAANLRKQVPELLKQHNAKSVEFKVVIKDGKATLKAVPK